MAIDGFELDVPDTAGNAEAFGYAGSGDNRSAFPKVRVVAVAECGTHAFVDAEVAPIGSGRRRWPRRCFTVLTGLAAHRRPRVLQLRRLVRRPPIPGRQLLWRAPTGLRLPAGAGCCPTGPTCRCWSTRTIRGARREQLIEQATAGARTRSGRGAAGPGRGVRRARPGWQGADRADLHDHRPRARPVRTSWPSAYHQRWEEETGNDQLKTHLRGPGKVLRSRLPGAGAPGDLGLPAGPSRDQLPDQPRGYAADIDPDRVSFAKALNIIRRTATGTAAFPPEHWHPVAPQISAELAARRNRVRERRYRTYPRVVRRARHNQYRVKKATDTGRRHTGPAQIRFYPMTVQPATHRNQS